jgi:hypothetical protein
LGAGSPRRGRWSDRGLARTSGADRDSPPTRARPAHRPVRSPSGRRDRGPGGHRRVLTRRTSGRGCLRPSTRLHRAGPGSVRLRRRAPLLITEANRSKGDSESRFSQVERIFGIRLNQGLMVLGSASDWNGLTGNLVVPGSRVISFFYGLSLAWFEIHPGGESSHSKSFRPVSARWEREHSHPSGLRRSSKNPDDTSSPTACLELS